MDFSLLEKSMASFADKVESKIELAPAPPFSDKEMSKSAQEKRVKRALSDFWYFDKIYFPAEMYGSGYFKPNQMLLDINESFNRRGVVDIYAGAREHGKTVTAKKRLAYSFLRGEDTIGASYSENLPNAQAILKDVAALIGDNERLNYDFSPDFEVDNIDNIQVRFLKNIDNKHYRYMRAFSEDRSVRGFTKMFNRPSVCIVDDCETLTSSLESAAVEKRINKLAEVFASLDTTKRLMLIFANNFDRRCAINQIRLRKELGIFAENWNVKIYPAWLGDKPLWIERFKNVKSEAELKTILKPKDEQDWLANYQQTPTPPEGMIFKREFYTEWDALPNDIKTVLYCDPNLSKKGKGDTTGITALGFSAKTQLYYVVAARCKSFSSSIALLDANYEIYSKNNISSVAFDGNVTQESVWTEFIKGWSREKGRPFRNVDYLRLRIDDLAKNAQSAFEQGKILFPPNFAAGKEGKNYIEQLFAFSGKGSNNKDDAPDSLIGAFEYIHQRRFVRGKSNPLLGLNASISLGNSYRF